MNRDRNVQKYLLRYSEPTAGWARGLDTPRYGAAVVLPAFDESEHFFDALLKADLPERTLLVLVVNAPGDASIAQRSRTEQLVRAVKERAGERAEEPCVLLSAQQLQSASVDCLLINALHPSLALKKKEGVGRARKLGCDAVLAMHATGKIDSEYVGFTDADASFDSSFVAALSAKYSECPAALSFGYRHEASGRPDWDAAMAHVESGFRWYVLGLHRAGSPYAYHSLGSAMAVSLGRYAEVRGIPNRQAGEDFHLLNKLVKLAPLRRLPETTVSLATRLSRRVPFGTGRSLWGAINEEPRRLVFRHPLVFSALGDFLAVMANAARSLRPPHAMHSWSSWPKWFRDEASSVYRDLEPVLRDCPSDRHRLGRFYERFDALATLQFIHRRERALHESCSLRDALRTLGIDEPGPATALAQLRAREDELPRVLGPTVAAAGLDEHP